MVHEVPTVLMIAAFSALYLIDLQQSEQGQLASNFHLESHQCIRVCCKHSVMRHAPLLVAQTTVARKPINADLPMCETLPSSGSMSGLTAAAKVEASRTLQRWHSASWLLSIHCCTYGPNTCLPAPSSSLLRLLTEQRTDMQAGMLTASACMEASCVLSGRRRYV